MKKLLSKVLLFVICGIAICGCFKLLQLQEQHEEKRAITRCGGESNIVTKYTKNGDTYYLCKVK